MLRACQEFGVYAIGTSPRRILEPSKRNSDISYNRMQTSYEILRENRRLQREVGCAGRSFRLRSPMRDLKAFLLSAEGVLQPESLSSTNFG